MQDLENNMDELFRKAAENYQIKPGESDWDNIFPRLDNADTYITKKKSSAKKNIIISLLILSFVCISTIFVKYILTASDPSAFHKKSQKDVVDQAGKKKNDVNMLPGNYKNHGEKRSTVQSSYSIKDHERLNSPLLSHKTKTFENGIATVQNKKPGDLRIVFNENDDKKKSIDQVIAIENSTIIEKGINDFLPINTNRQRATKQHGIYLGLILGVSFNEVKNQGLQKPGYDIGITAGYQLSDRASVETGILLAQKKYFTDSQYFSMDKISSSMPPEMKVLSVEGSSTILEIPLKFKYNILDKHNNVIYSTAGLSSYILINEKNNYSTMMNGSKENITGTYKNSSGYLAASVNVSVGYEHAISDRDKIRVEPYIQIPLKGIGMGTLPIKGLGLHVGYTLFTH